MSVAFSSARPRTKGEVTPQTIQKMLDENHHLIQCIMDYQSKGKTAECTQYQQILHRNLVYLATIADSNQNMQSLLPAPPTHNMGMSQGSGHTSGNDNMTSGLTPTSMMQSNGHNQTPMQQQQSGQVPPTAHSTYVHGGHPSQSSMVQGPGPAYASSSSSASFSSRSNLNIQSNQVSMMHQSGTPHYSSAQLGGQHYQGQQAVGLMGQGSQGNNMMSQRPMGTYRTSQPGHGDYSYQQSSYGEQYERSFDESSQHYYEGNSQYSQQQGQYQQGSSQQSFGQQQYSSQPSYGGPPQGYGPGQGSSSQYSQYQQGQGQQYGSYRSSQGGGQAQRPYSYEQGQYGNYQQ